MIQLPPARPWNRAVPLLPAAAAALVLLYAMGVDQGWLLSIVQGSSAFDINFIHEFVHDARHAAGFPCH